MEPTTNARLPIKKKSIRCLIRIKLHIKEATISWLNSSRLVLQLANMSLILPTLYRMKLLSFCIRSLSQLDHSFYLNRRALCK